MLVKVGGASVLRTIRVNVGAHSPSDERLKTIRPRVRYIVVIEIDVIGSPAK
jgi:hypothetical protein